MSSSSDAALYQRGMELARQGRNEEALACFQEHLRRQGDDGQAWNDAGTVLYALGRFDEAEAALRRAVEVMPNQAAQSLENLAEVYLAAGRPAEALAMFPALRQAGALKAPLAHRMATAFLQQARPDEAIETLLQWQQAAPQEMPALAPILEDIRRRRPSIAFFRQGCLESNAGAILDHLAQRFQTRLVRGSAEEVGDQLPDSLKWCHIAWFEGCTSALAAVTQGNPSCRILCRLGPHDVLAPQLSQVRWDRVSAIVYWGDRFSEEVLRRRLGEELAALRLVAAPDGVDVQAIPLAGSSDSRRLACVGPLDYPQNPLLLLQGLHALRRQDNRYRLHVAGMLGDSPGLVPYLQQMIRRLDLSDAVIFEGWQEDLTAWLRDKDVLVSASAVNDQPLVILKAMAAGIKPVVHAFAGSEGFFPPQCLFDTVEEFCRKVTDRGEEQGANGGPAWPRFPLRAQLEQIDGLLVQMETLRADSPTSRGLAARSAPQAAAGAAT